MGGRAERRDEVGDQLAHGLPPFAAAAIDGQESDIGRHERQRGVHIELVHSPQQLLDRGVLHWIDEQAYVIAAAVSWPARGRAAASGA